MTSPALEVRNLFKSYDEGRIEALRGVDLSIADGEYVAITGPSGSGKSTLLHMLGGLDSPTTGEVLFRNVSLGSTIDLDTYRSRNVGFIFQAFHLMPTLRAIENVQVPMIGLNRGGFNRATRARDLLREMGLENRMEQYPNQLSAGERQRVAIARVGRLLNMHCLSRGQFAGNDCNIQVIIDSNSIGRMRKMLARAWLNDVDGDR